MGRWSRDGVTHPQAKERQGLPRPPEAGGLGQSLPHSPRGPRLAHTLVWDFRPPDSGATHFCCVAAQWGVLLGQPQDSSRQTKPLAAQGRGLNPRSGEAWAHGRWRNGLV